MTLIPMTTRGQATTAATVAVATPAEAIAEAVMEVAEETAAEATSLPFLVPRAPRRRPQLGRLKIRIARFTRAIRA